VLPREGAVSLKQALLDLSQIIYGKEAPNYLADIPEIESMSALVEYTAKLCGFEETTPAFL
jgi:hypothetical protein